MERSFWQMFTKELENGVEPSACDELVREVLSTVPATDAVTGASIVPNSSIRSSEVRWLYDDDERWEDLFKQVWRFCKIANNNAFGFDITNLSMLQFTTYRAERAGHYRWHSDTFWTGNKSLLDRKVSLVIQLSDPRAYVGGDFELEVDYRPCPRSIKEQGTVIVFPSFVQHRVLPVLEGVRHSIVAWCQGPRLR